MADIYVPAGDATAVTIFSKRLLSHAMRHTAAAKFIKIGLNPDDPNNIVQMFDEPTKGPGDTIKYDLIPNIVGPGVLGDNPITGQTKSFKALQDSFTINQQRQGEKAVGRMSQQRVPYSIRSGIKTTLANWWAQTFDIGFFNQIAGNTAQTNVLYTGLNAAVAPDSAHHIYASTATSEATLTSSMIFDVSLISQVNAMARGTLTFPIKPLNIGGMKVNGVMFLHPLQVKALRNSYSAGGWADIQKAAYQGLADSGGNPIFSGALGMIDNVVLHEAPNLPYGDDTQNTVYDPELAANVAAPTSLGAAATGTTSVARAVFVGAQALAMGFGGAEQINGKTLKVSWSEAVLDHGNQLEVVAGMIYGMKKTVFASQDYATIVVSSWAA
jgi:N4-gp56 family major capsid protein